MPSGAKKRKAAKKKKENQPSYHPNLSSASTLSHGGDNVKHQHDNESDIREVSSPASQDHHSQHNALTEEKEDEFERDIVLDLPSTGGSKINVARKRNVVGEGTAIPVEKEFKIEHDESGRKSYDSGSSRSSSSSSSRSSGGSDDESHDIKSDPNVAAISSAVDSVKVADTFCEEHVEAIGIATTVGASDSVVENVPSLSNDNSEKKQSCTEDEVGVSEAAKDATSQGEEAIVPSVENVAQKTDYSLNSSYDAPTATADDGGDAEKDSGVTEPLLVPSSQPVETTSWKSCCGLFEVFSGSAR